MGNTFSDMTKEHDEANLLAMAIDSTSFAKMCREAPDLAKNIGRTEVDLIFTSVKPIRARRLDYDHFLDALLELSIRIYPDADPTTSLANFLARFIFALFDQPPATSSMNVVEKIYSYL
jgi:hypothetical protein